MAEDYTFRTTEANGITYFDVVLATGDDAVSIEAELDVETGGAWWWFIADYADGSSGSFLCNDMRIFGRGGNDIITVSHVPWGTVFGGWGRDTINVSNATQVVCLPLSSAEQLEAAQNPALLDEEDTFNFDNAKSCAALGGDGADVYNLSGDCNTTTLDGGNGGDVVNAGRLTNFRDGYVTLGNGLNKISGATGDWSNTFIRGGPNADQIDLRLASADVTDTDGVGGARIQTEGGNDVIYGTTGNDYISPGEGADTVFAGSGNDAVQLIDGWKDIADGGQGHDIVEVDWDNFWHQPAESRLTNFEVTSAGNA